MLRQALVLSAPLLMAGCMTTPPAVSSRLCEELPVAPYAVKGDTREGQFWIDTTIEVEVASCGHPRPPAKPEMRR